HTRSDRDWSSDVCSSDLDHWTRLPARRRAVAAEASRWPPLLRWLDGVNEIQARALVALEHLALGFRFVRRFMVDRHVAAFAALRSEERRVGKERRSRGSR